MSCPISRHYLQYNKAVYSLLIPKLILEAYPENPNAMSIIKSNNLSKKITNNHLRFTLWRVREYPLYDDRETEERAAIRRYCRIYQGGKKCLVDLVEIKEVYVDEMDALMTQIGYETGQTNYFCFLKPGCTLDDGFFSLREAANVDLLKDVVIQHKLIDVYVEIGKIRLELSEMSPQSIKTVFWEMDEDRRKVATAAIQSCCRRLVLDDIDNEPALDQFIQLTQFPVDVNVIGEASNLPNIEPLFSTLDCSFASQPVQNSERALVVVDEDNALKEPDNVEVNLFRVIQGKDLVIDVQIIRLTCTHDRGVDNSLCKNS